MPWVEQPKAILEGYLGGQAGAGAIADVLYGEVNPGGKLAETFPIRQDDNPSHNYFPGGPKTVEYRESVYVGYRYYDKVGQKVLFPFGYGLSYTTFEYGDLQLGAERISDRERLSVSLQVTNSGSVTGKEVVQLYVRPLEAVAFRPLMELKGFHKVELDPGQSTTVSFELDRRAFSFYNTGIQDWHVTSGAYEILVGASSRDIRLSGVVQIDSTQAGVVVPERDRLPAYVEFSKQATVEKADFERLLGRKLPSNELVPGEPATLNTPISEMRFSFIGRYLGNYMQRQVEVMTKDDPDSVTSVLMRAMIGEAPLRTLFMMGGMDRPTLESLLLLVNRKYFAGIRGMLRSRSKR